MLQTEDPIVLEIRRQVTRWRRRRRLTIGISATSAACGMLAVMLMMMLANTVMLKPSIGLLLLFVLLLIGGLVGLLVGVLMRPLSGNVINKLWMLQGVSALGPLAEVTQMLLPQLTPIAEKRLSRELLHLRETDGDAFTPFQRRYLRKLLTSKGFGVVVQPTGTLAYSQKALVLGLLHAIELIGTGADLGVVSRLADGRMLASHDPDVKLAAQRCRDALHARIVEEQNPARLLRAAAAPTGTSDSLLRPASNSSDVDPQVLLRTPTESIVGPEDN